MLLNLPSCMIMVLVLRDGLADRSMSESIVGKSRIHPLSNNTYFTLPIYAGNIFQSGSHLQGIHASHVITTSLPMVYSTQQDDAGTPYEDSVFFTTFIKARIRCTAGISYHYNDLYGTHYIPEERRLYAVFRTPL